MTIPDLHDGVTPNRTIAPARSVLTTVVPITAAAAAGLLLPFEPRLALLLVVFVALVARGLGGFESLLHLLLASVFVESVTVGPLRVGRVLALVAVATVVARMVATGWRPPRLRPATWVPAALFAVWAWASGFWARDHGPWSFAMLQLALGLCFFAAFALFVESPGQVRRLLRTYVVAAVAAGLLGIAQAFAGGSYGRAAGLQGDANIFAMYQVAAVAAAVGLMRTSGRDTRRAWQLAIVVLVASIVASESRGGLIALGVVSLWLLGNRLRTFTGVATAAALIGLGAGIVLSVPALRQRVSPSRVQEDRGSGRIDIWYVAWKAGDRQPLIGLGGGNFKSHSIELLERQPGVQLVKSHLLLLADGIEVHNVYLETFVEYGVPGALLFVIVLGTTAWHLRRRRRGPVPRRTSSGIDTARADADAVLQALTGMLLAFAAAAIFLSIVNNKLLWALVGIAAARWAQPRDGAPAVLLPR